MWTVALFWYCIYNDFDGSYLFDYTYIILVNVAFTSLPVIFMGIFDQDVDDKVSLAVPQLYMRGIERKEWSQTKFWYVLSTCLASSLTTCRLYMFDGLYQSLICFFMPYLLYQPFRFVTENGLNVNDRVRMGVLVATAAVVASNTYIMMNTYRWDWLTVLINAISSLLIFFWTGIYSSVPASGQFYGSAKEVYGTLNFWVVLLLTVTICLLPRFAIKSVQKVFFPLDVDIIREQWTQGRFKYLDQFDSYVPPKAGDAVGGSRDESAASSDLAKPIEAPMKQDPSLPDDERPIYPPSVAPTATTHNQRSQSGSNGTNYTDSLDTNPRPQSVDYGRRSPERTRHSFDRVRHSMEVGHDFTSAQMLSKLESSNSASMQVPQSPSSPLKGRQDPPLYHA